MRIKIRKKPRPVQVPCTPETKKKITGLAMRWRMTYVAAMERIIAGIK